MPVPNGPVRQSTEGLPSLARSGTPVATVGIVESGVANPGLASANKPARSPRKGWGGARNRRDRTSDRITAAQASDLIEAAAHAERIGLPLNRHCTIHWGKSGIPDSLAGRATGDYLRRAGEWLRGRGMPFAYAYSREVGEGKGSHAHILLHVPPAARAAFGHRHPRWARLAAHCSSRLPIGTVRSVAIGGARAGAGAGAIYADNLDFVVGYILKGVTRSDARALSLRRRPRRDGSAPNDWGTGGCIIGKRVGWSENIGRAARRSERNVR